MHRGRRGILDREEAREVNRVTGTLGLREWTAKRSLERESGEGPGHGGLSGFNVPVARRSPEFMGGSNTNTINCGPCIQGVYVPVGEMKLTHKTTRE